MHAGHLGQVPRVLVITLQEQMVTYALKHLTRHAPDPDSILVLQVKNKPPRCNDLKRTFQPTPTTLETSMESPITESATCTICGLKCDERSAFNAHIRAHLKDKLTNRRKLQQQKQPTANSPSSSSSTAASCPQQPPRDSIKRAKVVPTNSSHSPQQPSMINKPVKDKSLTNITSLLPSSPLPMTQATLVKEKPDLEALLSQLKQPSRDNPMVMAELAACRPIPPKATNEVAKKKFNSPQPPPLAQAKVTSINTPCTPEISDMEDDLMSYEMEMNRIDFHNDLAFLLDQIEKDFEGPCIGQDFRLDTPPDSDCETDSFGRLLNQISTSPTVTSSALSQPAQDSPVTPTPDLLGLDRFARRIDDNLLNPPIIPTSLQSESIRLVQSPASVAKVGKLPAKTLAVLNKLPAKLFVPNQQQLSILPASFGGKNEHRFVDVVKVESSGLPSTPLSGLMSGQYLPSSAPGGAQCIINIECRNPNEPAKIIQTYRAIDTGNEIKLVPADLPIKTESIDEPMTVTAVSDDVKNKANNVASTSHCPICNKCITNKNMARHLEKHQNSDSTVAAEDRKFTCKFCCKSFSQRSHLSRHAKAHTSAKGDLLTCRVCGKVCKNRISLVRHRTKHLSCVHCSALFDNKITLQDHLLKAHPEKAIVSLVQPPEADTRLDLDDLGSIGSATSHSVDYSFSPSAGSSGPNEVSSIGDSLAEIADTNYFYCGGSDITDDLYSTDIFSAAASAATATTC